MPVLDFAPKCWIGAHGSGATAGDVLMFDALGGDVQKVAFTIFLVH